MAVYTPTLTTTNPLDAGVQFAYSKLVEIGANAGTGYAVNDVLTLSGGTSTAPMTFVVTSINTGGAVSGIKLRTVGDYTAYPATPALTTTSGSGTGCRLKLPFATITAMLEDYLLKWARSYRRQYQSLRQETLMAPILADTATNTQMNNAAAALGVTLP